MRLVRKNCSNNQLAKGYHELFNKLEKKNEKGHEYSCHFVGATGPSYPKQRRTYFFSCHLKRDMQKGFLFLSASYKTVPFCILQSIHPARIFIRLDSIN